MLSTMLVMLKYLQCDILINIREQSLAHWFCVFLGQGVWEEGSGFQWRGQGRGIFQKYCRTDETLWQSIVIHIGILQNCT